MSSRTDASKRASKEQAKVWLATVVAPLSNALRVETERAARGSWSFRCTTQDFEFLWPTGKIVSDFYFPNLEQFWRYYPALRRVAVQHDEALAKLGDACRNAFEKLIRSEDFIRLAESTGVKKEEWQFFAEYVINGIRDLDSFYSLNDIWKQRGAEFLGLRERPTLARALKSVDDAGASFRRYAEALLPGLQRAQQELADEYQLPPVDPLATATV